MLKKICNSCGKKIERKFHFCPYCGYLFRKQENEEDFGLIGKDDALLESQFNQELRLPLNLNKLMNSLIDQIGKEIEVEEGRGQHGFKIQISTGKPQIKHIEQEEAELSEEEITRRKRLPKEEPKSNVRRLGDKIVYEIHTPEVKSKKDVVITKLEDSIEIRAYSKNKCFHKVIPLKIEILKYYLKNNTLFLELKG